MKTNNITLGTNSNYQIFSQLWEPEISVESVIILIHGLGEHSGRYDTHFANYFLHAGFSILSFDLPGHGKSDGQRGHIKDYNDFDELISAAISYAKNKYPSLPIFIYGHSLGGLIALEYSIQVNPAINGVIASAPVLDVYEPINSAKLMMAKIMNTTFPSFSLDNGINRNMLSRDKNVVDKYNADPLVHGRTSARMGMYVIEKGEIVRNNANKVSLPTLIMVGSADEIVSKNAIHDFCNNSKNCEEKIWAGFYHEIHNEPNYLSVLEFASKWMASNK